MTRLLSSLVLLALAWVAAPAAALADRLDVVRQRGALAVGVKTDYPPFGMLDAGGAIVGFEPDLARDLAARLGVELRLVGVSAANRLQKLEDGSVDLILATMGDTAERRRIVAVIEPSYYASGANVMTPPGKTLNGWSDLRGQKVCVTQGSLFNRSMEQRHLLELQVFNGARDARLALRDGRCVGWLYDDTAIAGDLRNPEWAGYGMPLTSAMLTPWSMALADAERGGRLERILSDAVADWHRSGFLLELEKRWGLKASPFVVHNNKLWNEKRDDGAPLCVRRDDGQWPTECRNEALATSEATEGVQRLGLLLKERTGLDFSVLYDAYDRNHFLSGLLATLQLALVCLFGSVLVGFAGAVAMEARVFLMSRAVEAFAAVGRTTPPLLQIYVVFFGLGGLAAMRFGWTFDGFLVAAVCLSLYAGSANVFALVEAAGVLRVRNPGYRLGLRNAAPAFRLAFGALSGSLVNIVKATGMASAVAVPELISASTAVMAERGNIGVMMNLLMVIYFLLIWGLVRALNAVERRIAGKTTGGA